MFKLTQLHMQRGTIKYTYRYTNSVCVCERETNRHMDQQQKVGKDVEFVKVTLIPIGHPR